MYPISRPEETLPHDSSIAALENACRTSYPEGGILLVDIVLPLPIPDPSFQTTRSFNFLILWVLVLSCRISDACAPCLTLKAISADT
jgi:hypothetical protein